MIRFLTIAICTVTLLQCTPKQNPTAPDQAVRKPSSGSCAPTLVGEYITDKAAPVFTGLDYFNFPITTSSKVAQKYFNQGWALAAGFNHAEAARSFYWAAQEDPDCAMCYWGLAYVLGPNYNAVMDPSVVSDAIQSITAAQLLSSNCTERERDLISAMTKRYPAKTEDDRSEFNTDYSNAFAALYTKYPKDHDIAALYAESLMNLHPWDLWDKEGNQREWTAQILDILSGIRKDDPNHAIGNHFYIHAVESSFKPEMGNEAANLLEDIAPGAGHLVHMPSHIYIRTGKYKDCSRVNVDAVNVDSVYTTACHAAGAYPLTYYPHNFHFLCACAALEGNGELAYTASIRMQEKLDTDIMREDVWGTIQHYYTIPYYIMVKFEMWDEIMATKMPDEDLKYPRAVLTYARGMALADMGKIKEAKSELEGLKTLAADDGVKSINIWEINEASDLTNIAELVLEAEILVNSNNYQAAIPILKKAIAIEDNLNYNEPPDWFFSVRHYLGDAYLQIGDWTAAEEAYRKDLFNFPENGWALSGLHKALEAQGRQSEADEILSRFDTSWERADRELLGSRVQ